MKLLLCILLLLPLMVKAQDSVVVITPAMFDKTTDQVYIAGIDGWIFHRGNDTNRAKKNPDVTGWQKLKPTQLSKMFADNTGKVEGWFRIKIRLSDSLMNRSMGMKQVGWAASDLYINGKLIHSVGNTGINGQAYKEFNPNGIPAYPVELKPGADYLLAFHVVDYVKSLPTGSLKTEQNGLRDLLRITGPDYNSYYIRGSWEGKTYWAIWIIVCAVLSVLFWLLYFQNREERNLRLIAIGTTMQTLLMYCNEAQLNKIGMSFNQHLAYAAGLTLFAAFNGIYTVLILLNIFKRKLAAWAKMLLILYFLGMITGFFLRSAISTPLSTLLQLLISLLCLYYIITSWKSLKGAQWTIVAGLLLSVLCVLIYFILVTIYQDISLGAVYILISGYSLAFPLSLLIYVSMRFKEIINDVRHNAAQVVQLSAEKEQQALNQQSVLQEEVKRQTAEIRNALDNLTATQSQLIQSEKMASLGELTAGIAHEIQNPLNFVNNFSEVNKELLVDLKDEIKKGNIDEVNAIADDVISNEEKINHHGKRADAIVKGMLQHSRSSSGKKEPTDINKLADEYLRLAYHGLRAKDPREAAHKSFNATMKTDFDESIGTINIIPQDIGRVILNLITNAFYAVDEKKKQTGNDYEPTVSISTKKINNEVVISISDNGNGIPDTIREKIFQPFFTTKPTGQGTGLGLSLAYDIVKAHGGELTVKTKEKEGTGFNIKLPL